ALSFCSSRCIVAQHTHTAAIPSPSLHDALPIYEGEDEPAADQADEQLRHPPEGLGWGRDGDDPLQPPGHLRHEALLGSSRTIPVDRKSTRLNSSHVSISYAVFCLKKKNVYQPAQ